MWNSKGIFGAMIGLMGVLAANGQQELALYEPAAVPNSKPTTITEVWADDGIMRVSGVTTPTLTAYFPSDEVENTGKAVIVCPGGGYAMLAIGHEGHDVARELAAHGVSAFVLKYRLPSDDIMVDKRIGPLQDVQRAMQLVRQRALEWGIAENEIGVAGFSAGGHLAATLSTHYGDVVIDNPENTPLRPDFSLLLYPVITMEEPMTHSGSRTNLLGSDPDTADVASFSNEKLVTAETPPAFLVHAEDDTVVPIANSEAYVAALKKNGVDAKLVTYPGGGHGFGLNNKTTTDKWFDHFLEWLAKH